MDFDILLLSAEIIRNNIRWGGVEFEIQPIEAISQNLRENLPFEFQTELF